MPYPVQPLATVPNTNVADGVNPNLEQNVDGFGNAYITNGGKNATAIAAGTAADTVIKATPGRLCRILVTTLGTNPMQVFDNASGHTGTIIGALAASAPVGTQLDLQMPAANGITVFGNASNPAVTIFWD